MRSLSFSLAISLSLIVLIPVGASGKGGLATRVAQLEAQVEALTAALQEAQEILQFVRVESEPINGLVGPHWIIEGANLHVRSGSGETLDGCNPRLLPDCKFTGLGNLIVGYNESILISPAPDRTGSHNLVVGPSHAYSSIGGFVAGARNQVLDLYASVSGGVGNVASGRISSVSGGSDNEASGILSSVGGGMQNEASGPDSSVSGGEGNGARGAISSVSGGRGNSASGFASSVSGGRIRTAPENFNWAAGNLLEKN